MPQDLCHNLIFQWVTELGIVVLVIGIAGSSDPAIAQAREEQMALLLRPLNHVCTEALFCPLRFRQINGRGNAGDFASRKEHRRAKMVERKPATGKPASEALNKWYH